MNIFKSEFSAEPNTQLKMLHFEAECKYAVRNGYDHIRDCDDRLFRLSGPLNDIDIAEVHESGGRSRNPDRASDRTPCMTLVNIDQMLLECTTSPMRLNQDSLDKMATLAHTKRVLLECL